MSPNQLLEDRAERGQQRGAANVWAAAIKEIDPTPVGRPNPWGRASFWLVGLAVAVVGIIGLRQFDGFDSVDETATTSVEVAQQDDDPNAGIEPAPILVEGMSLRSVYSTSVEPDGVSVTSSDVVIDAPTKTTFFGNPTDPFSSPILAIENLDGGGFRPWALNLNGASLDGLVDNLIRADGEWTIGDDPEMVQLGSVTDEAGQFPTWWQFDFESGDKTITLQAEKDAGGEAWLWITRLAPAEGETMDAKTIEVVGTEGVLVTSSTGADFVTWESDGFNYVARAGEVVSDTHEGRLVADKIDSLVVVNRADWQAAIEGAGGFTTSSIAVPIGLVLMVLWILSSIWFLYKGPRWLAAPLPVAGLVFLALTPDVISLLLLIGGLIAAWGYFALRKDGDDPSD